MKRILFIMSIMLLTTGCVLYPDNYGGYGYPYSGYGYSYPSAYVQPSLSLNFSSWDNGYPSTYYYGNYGWYGRGNYYGNHFPHSYPRYYGSGGHSYSSGGGGHGSGGYGRTWSGGGRQHR